MKIAILGWGSLIWDTGSLLITGDGWRLGGPKLPLEFSRISSSRKGALTLVIDENRGELAPARYAMSQRDSLDDAIEDLRSREGCPQGRIGFVCSHQREKERSKVPGIADKVREWAEAHKFDAVIWTNLPPNFDCQLDRESWLDKAVEYLDNLRGEGLEKAREYVRKAPPEVDTPLRRRLAENHWLASD
jgi:hypothetical protein